MEPQKLSISLGKKTEDTVKKYNRRYTKKNPPNIAKISHHMRGHKIWDGYFKDIK